jgi:hypothetical protein
MAQTLMVAPQLEEDRMMSRHIGALLLGLTFAVPAVAAAQDTTSPPDPNHPRMGVNARERRQKARIKDGKEDGQLTKAEMDKLKADEAGVRAEEKVYRQSGDGLNKRERKDLQKDLNKTSREIHRAKHNGRTK